MTAGYARARSWEEVGLHAGPGSRFLAGGTDLLPLIAAGLENPSKLVDIGTLGFATIGPGPDGGGLSIGALVTMAEVARNPLVGARAQALAQSAFAAASPQIRNMATTGGNLLQKTRCAYFRDPALSCNRRRAGSGCPAVAGNNRHHALFGATDACCAVHGSDIAVALEALDAVLVARSAATGPRLIPVSAFYRLAESPAQADTVLDPGEILVEIRIPGPAQRSAFGKIRDRASFEYALVSTAVSLSLADGRLRDIRIVLGGVAHKPWRLPTVERRLTGCRPTPDHVARAFDGWDADASPLRDNRFKAALACELAIRTICDLAGTDNVID